MPRKVFKKNSGTIQRAQFKDFVADESTSTDSEKTFQSASTDEDITNYHLQYTNGNTSLPDKSPSRTRGPSSPRRKPGPLSSRKERNRSREERNRSREERNRSREERNRSREERNRSQRNASETHSSRSGRRVTEGTSSRDVSRRSEVALTRSRQQRPSEPMPSTSKTQETSARRRETSARRRGSSKRKHFMPKKASPTRNPNRNFTSGRRYKRKNNVERNIKYLQQTAHHLIPKLPFGRLIREVMNEFANADFRISRDALEALQESSEIYLTQFFEDAYRCTLHRNRVTLIGRDIELLRYLRGRLDPGNPY